MHIQANPSFGRSYCARVPIHILEGPHRQEQPRTTRLTLRYQGPLKNYQANDGPEQLLRFNLKLETATAIWANNASEWKISFPEEPSQVLKFAIDDHFSTHPTFIPPLSQAKSANFTKFTLSPPVKSLHSQLPIISARARYHALWASIFRAFGINFSCFWHHFRALKYFANCKTGQSGLINFASSATTFLYFGFYSSTIWAIFYSLPISHLASVVTCGHVEHRSRPIEDKVSLG